MTRSWSVSELERWDERIRELAREAGLTWFPQEFEVCDHAQMLGYMAYSGMPAHYPHWSYGKSYERLKTLYDHGVSGLPYEMVINSDPSVAYLMQGNSLCLHILTIAHVYGHNDFFKNNFLFRETRPELLLPRIKNHGERVRRYVEDPSIGIDAVERILDAAHALSFNCRRDRAIRKLTPDEQRQRAIDRARPPDDPHAHIHPAPAVTPPDLRRVPLEAEEDILLFIRDHNPYLTEWQRDLLAIVHEEAIYFLPQIETKIMNEGWASYWHYSILNQLDLPQDLHLEFLVHHSQVLRPHPGSINPYYVGFKIWQDIFRRWQEPTAAEVAENPELAGGGRGRDKIFEVRESDRDVSFLRRFLTPEIMRELDLWEYRKKGEEYVISELADAQGWQKVKETLLKNIGTASFPVIRIEDADWQDRRALFLRHAYDGRDLQVEYASKTLAHLYTLWGRQVVLETEVEGKKVQLTYGEDGFGKTVL